MFFLTGVKTKYLSIRSFLFTKDLQKNTLFTKESKVLDQNFLISELNINFVFTGKKLSVD